MPRLALYFPCLAVLLATELAGAFVHNSMVMYDDMGPSQRYSWYLPSEEELGFKFEPRIVTRDVEEEENGVLSPSANRELVKLFEKYKNREKIFQLTEKRTASLEGVHTGAGRFEWLKKSPKSIIIGTIAAITLFMGITLLVGIVIRRRYLLNRMASSRSPTGSIIGQESGDKKLAHSAQMYHYQFQKQQILAMEKASIKNELSDEEGTDVETDGDFTVYECAGIQPSNDIEVKNPLFEGAENSSDDGSPLADDELLNTSTRSSLENDDTYVAKKE